MRILVVYITDMTMQKKVMTKNGHQIFGQEKCTPAEKILAMPMGKRGDYQNCSVCSVLYCVLKLCTVISTLR